MASSPPTIRDVAKRAQVGVATVSRVLNNSPNVTPATRALVMKAIEELGFRPNAVARQLTRKTRLHNIGVITQLFLSYRSFAHRLRGVQLALSDYADKYELVLYTVSSLDHYAERLAYIANHRLIEGLVIVDLDLDEGQKQMLHNSGIPFVGINHFRDRDWPCIGADNREGARVATQYLIDLGHRDIGYLGDTFESSYEFITGRERFESFWQTLHANEIPIQMGFTRFGEHDYDEALELSRDLLSQPKRPTAIFAMSDMQALACIAAAREMGLHVPEDLSVIGYDDLEIAYHTGLTTVRQHLEMNGTIALKTLIDRIHGEEHTPETLPPPEVIARQTTRRLDP
ncbi:MAG: LacI family transcriptional regulator [Anaerolineae bacterium]|jgi:DNA-binding LacI/PurR family transcriptional regulator|nr:LacI family transcriptional regulator [Anaerolineae bacterium]